MQFAVSNEVGHTIAGGITDNPYQVRNIIVQYLNGHNTFDDEHTVHSHGVTIKSSVPLKHLLLPSPTIKEENAQVFPPTVEPETGSLTLQQICRSINMKPQLARRILRKKFGTKNQRYEWSLKKADDIKNLITTRRK